MGALILAFAFGALLVVLLARFGRNPTEIRGEAAARQRRVEGDLGPYDRIQPRALHDLTIALFERIGLPIVEDADDPEAARQRLVASQPGPFGDRRHLVMIEAAPPGDIVDATAPLALAEEVKADPGSIGVLVTPYVIDREGMGTVENVTLVDGPELSALVARHLPERLRELERYRLGSPEPQPA
jgi:hypothetical protein